METDVAPAVRGPRRYRNSETMLAIADPAWQTAADNGLIGLDVDVVGDRLVMPDSGHEFVNLCSCSYLGLNRHPRIIEGAVRALQTLGINALSVSATRIMTTLQTRVEDALGQLFSATVLPGLSCGSLAAGILPLLASGQLADGGPRVMVFDRFAHFCMAYVKPICGDEALVLTIDHNDVDQLEDICRRYPRVAYVSDGVYSMGGATRLDDLVALQERYGLFLFVDDSHALSAFGAHGEGLARSRMDLTPLTIIVASLQKGFGAKGGVAMLGEPRLRDLLMRHAGPLGWSQGLGVADLGAALASAEIHRSPELGELQRKLRSNIELFDWLLPTSFAGNGLAIRLVEVGEPDRAVELSGALLARGYYASAVFFPIVPRGQAGIRIMLRADLSHAQITEIAQLVKELVA
jgi:7-keto-8-aminopelargonate synthetase-like enzyme